jgi:hypothetical protein
MATVENSTEWLDLGSDIPDISQRQYHGDSDSRRATDPNRP